MVHAVLTTTMMVPTTCALVSPLRIMAVEPAEIRNELLSHCVSVRSLANISLGCALHSFFSGGGSTLVATI